MIKLVICAGAAMLAMGSTVSAQDVCSSMARLAERMMTDRQDGVSLADTLETSQAAVPEGTRDTVKKMVIAAYEVPHFATEKSKNTAIGDFRDSIHLECLKAE